MWQCGCVVVVVVAAAAAAASYTCSKEIGGRLVLISKGCRGFRKESYYTI